jgi:hypothetical protein
VKAVIARANAEVPYANPVVSRRQFPNHYRSCGVSDAGKVWGIGIRLVDFDRNTGQRLAFKFYYRSKVMADLNATIRAPYERASQGLARQPYECCQKIGSENEPGAVVQVIVLP